MKFKVSPWFVLAIRVVIGLLLLVAGILKAHDGAILTTTSIAAYRILPPNIVSILGVTLPYFEIILGLYLITGLCLKISAWVATLQFCIFSIAVASLIIRNIPADCGCFGSGIPTPPSWLHVSADLLLMVLSLFIALSNDRLYSLDSLFDNFVSNDNLKE